MFQYNYPVLTRQQCLYMCLCIIYYIVWVQTLNPAPSLLEPCFDQHLVWIRYLRVEIRSAEQSLKLWLLLPSKAKHHYLIKHTISFHSLIHARLFFNSLGVNILHRGFYKVRASCLGMPSIQTF